ncbi:MAG: glycosyltransferase, partial [Holosporales bacterium]|nr:glycosyltransferase [Holosporales bacterium]
MTKRILIAAGGTGGHVFPASCLAHALKKNEITFATDQRGIKYINSFNQVIIQNIKTTPRTMLYASLLINTLKSFIYLIKNRQNIVIGFGGYASIPFLIAAQSLGIKTVIHEQNAIIGKANKLLSKFAFKIVTSFENTKGLSPSNKIHHIGNPTRFEAEYNIKNTKQNDIFTILIFGGSQGASDFSNDVADAICKISKEHKIKVYHQCPAEELDKTTNKYAA